MNILIDIFQLVKKELQLELRQKYAIGGILLYVLSTIFLVFTAAIKIQPQMWGVIYWIIILFAAVNALLKSFVQENGQRQLYYYTMLDPVTLWISKFIYNVVLMFFIGVLTYLIYTFFVGNPVKDFTLFFGILALGSIGIAASFSFVSSIAVHANNSATLMAILGFPVILPILMLLIKLTVISLRLIQETSYLKDVALLFAIDLLAVSFSIILFPFVWKD